MRKITNFCGVFATLFVTTTIILLASCSQDDDYYESDMYTLAEMGTRLGGDGGDPGGGNNNTMYETDGVFQDVVFSSDSFGLAPNVKIDVSVHIKCSFEGTVECATYKSHTNPSDIDSVHIVHSSANTWGRDANYMMISADFIAQHWVQNDTLGRDTIHYSGHSTIEVKKSDFTPCN